MSAAVVSTKRVDLNFGGVELSMLCVADLDPHVDESQLLGAGEVDEPPYWMHLWPGARALAARLGQWSSLGGKRVLEVGCGMGLPALLAARCGARVVATDWQRAPLSMLAESARLNRCEIGLVQMDWRQVAVSGDFDLLLGADVAYDAAEEDALVAAFAARVVAGGTLLLADSVNTYRLGLPDKLEKAGFTVRETKAKEIEEGRVVWVRCLEGVKR